MKKLLLALACLSIQTVMYAQDVSFKKDAYKVDGETVATVEEKRSDNLVNKNFTILNTAGQELITLKIKVEMNPLGFNNPTWYEVTFVPLNIRATRPLSESLLGARKQILEEFADMNVIGKAGLNDAGVKSYTDKYAGDLAIRSKAFVDSIKDMTMKSTHIVQRNKDARIKVGHDNTITQDKVQIGTWEKYGKDGDYRYIIKNDIGGITGVITYTSGFTKGLEISAFFGGDRHQFSGSEANLSPNDKDTETIEKFVAFMIKRNGM